MDRAINGGRQFIDAHQQFTGAMGHHAMNPLHGAAQAVSHGVQSLTDRLPQGNPVRQIVGETVASDDAALRQREADYQARVPDSMASYAGAAAGEVVDRKSVVSGKRVSVRVDLGGRRIIKKTKILKKH